MKVCVRCLNGLMSTNSILTLIKYATVLFGAWINDLQKLELKINRENISGSPNRL